MKRLRENSVDSYSSDSEEEYDSKSRKKLAKRILNVRRMQDNADAILFEALDKEFYMTTQDEEESNSSYLRFKKTMNYNIKDLERIGAGEISKDQLHQSETEKYLSGSKKKLENKWGRRKLRDVLEEDPIFKKIEEHTQAPPSEMGRRFFCIICGDFTKYADSMSAKRTCSVYCYNALQQKGHN
mmetsp:Transcript_8851/g.13139  ORF Transcript_8851/g.13139 Transcript_8851/m.13139 type:complete len:184 (-) Transcript_8851:60-611(-)